MFPFLKKHAQNHIKLLVFVLLTSFIAMLTGVISPYVNGAFLDSLITMKRFDSVLYYAGLFLLVGLGSVLSNYLTGIATAKLSTKLEYNIVAELVSHIHRIPFSNLSIQLTSSALSQQVISDSGELANFATSNVAATLLNGIAFGAVIILMFIVNKLVFLSFCVFVPLYAVIFAKLKKPLFRSNYIYKIQQTRFYQVFFEQLNLTLPIKMKSSFEMSQRHLDRSFEQYYCEKIRNARVNLFFASLDDIVAFFFQVTVLVIGGYQIVIGEMTIGEYTIVNTYFAMLLKIIKYYFGFGKSLQSARASFERLNQVLAVKQETNGSEVIDTINSINVDSVCISFNETKRVDMSAKHWMFNRGKIYNIRGVNGSGKTSLVFLIVGILRSSNSGKVEINGTRIEKIDMYKLRQKNISVLLQAQPMPDMTVEEYLLYELELTFSQLAHWVDESHLSHLFMCKTFDFRNLQNQRLCTLSGGEQQKLRLMQALLKPADVLILDEPTSFLDKESVEKLQIYLELTKETRIIILIEHTNLLDEVVDECCFC